MTVGLARFDVPTSLTPVPSHLLRFHFVGCAKEVSNLINRPVVSPLGTRVGGTSHGRVGPPVDQSETSSNLKPREAFPPPDLYPAKSSA
jgi:hypothetical protein